jgi:hypothetical protein
MSSPKLLRRVRGWTEGARSIRLTQESVLNDVYTIVGTEGEPEDVEVDFYETDGSEYVFYAEGAEMLRVPIAERPA